LRAKAIIEETRFQGLRRVIDLSADSANNWNGPQIPVARGEVLAAGIVINGLAVLCRDCWSGQPVSYDLERAFADQSIGGPGSFVVSVENSAAFAAAVRRKLILETAGSGEGGRPRLATADQFQPGCAAGQLWVSSVASRHQR